MDSASFLRLFRYDAWANQQVLAALESAGIQSGRPVNFLAHILGAQSTWLSRLEGQPSSLPIWPEFTLDDCRNAAAPLAASWQRLLEGLTAPDFDRIVTYANSRGQSFADSVADILTQVSTHGCYHRGQIALELRAAGHNPPLTDFIVGVRVGALA